MSRSLLSLEETMKRIKYYGHRIIQDIIKTIEEDRWPWYRYVVEINLAIWIGATAAIILFPILIPYL